MTLTLDQWEKLATTIISFVTVAAIISGGSFALIEYLDRKTEGKKVNSLKLVSDYHSKESRKYREKLDEAWEVGYPLLEPILSQESYSLLLKSVATTDGIVDTGRSLVIVALVNNKDLHIRIFDTTGKQVLDKAENELISGETLTTLKKRLMPFPSMSSLSQEEKQEIIKSATLITGHTRQEAEKRSKAFNAYVKILVDKEKLSREIDYVMDFYERVAACVNSGLCNKSVIDQFLLKSGRTFFRKYYPHICTLRTKWRDDSIWLIPESYFNPDSVGKICS